MLCFSPLTPGVGSRVHSGVIAVELSRHRGASPVLDETDQTAVELLASRLLAGDSARIRKLILYGSRARGSAAPDSDFDLLVVEADPVSKREELRRLSQLLSELPYSVDLWVMGEMEFEETKGVIGGLAYPAHKYGVVLVLSEMKPYLDAGRPA